MKPDKAKVAATSVEKLRAAESGHLPAAVREALEKVMGLDARACLLVAANFLDGRSPVILPVSLIMLACRKIIEPSFGLPDAAPVTPTRKGKK